MIRWTILKYFFFNFIWRTKWCSNWGSCWWHWLEWLLMDMGTKPLLKILFSSSAMILILWMGRFYACFVALKWSQLGSHRFCLKLNPKTHSSSKFCKEVPIVWMHWSSGIKLWVLSHGQGSYFIKWTIMWKIIRIINCLWSFWRRFN
jgi:hypothetical protein